MSVWRVLPPNVLRALSQLLATMGDYFGEVGCSFTRVEQALDALRESIREAGVS